MGGAQFQAQGLVNILAESGEYDVYYLARRIKEGYTPVNHTVVQICHPGVLQRLATFFEAPQLLRQLHHIKPDIIYQRVGCAYTGIAAYYAKKNKIKLLWHVASTNDCTPQKFRFYDLLRRPYRFIEKSLLEYGVRNASAIVVQTDDQKALLKKHYNIDADRVIRNFLDISTDPEKNRSTVSVLWIGNFKRLKQPQYFIELADRLGELTSARFIMIGACSPEKGWQNELDARIQKNSRLVHLGELSQHDVNYQLDKAHILVNTSIYEGFSNTFIQAWMRRVPVLSLNVNPDDVLEKHGLGKVAGNMKNLCSSVQALIHDHECREQMGERARRYAVENHSMRNAQRLASFISEILQDHPNQKN